MKNGVRAKKIFAFAIRDFGFFFVDQNLQNYEIFSIEL